MSSTEDVVAGRRVPVLDGVRGLAVLMVVGFHTLGTLEDDFLSSGFDLFARTLWTGVDLFFVLSGFLITGVLLNTRSGGRGDYFRRFYASRALRIFPLYYGVLIGLLVVTPLVLAVAGRVQPDFLVQLRAHQIWLWTYMQNWYQAGEAHRLPGTGHLWSLAVEEQFYLVWPFVVLALAARRLLQVCIGAVVVVLALRVGLSIAGVDGLAIRHFTITRADTLLIGAGLAVALRDERLRARVQRFAPAVLAGALVGLAIVFAIVGRVGYDEDALVVTVGFTLVALAGAGLIAVSLERPLLDQAWLRTMGKYSYAVYVFHLPIAHAVVSRLPRVFPDLATDVPQALTAFAITLGSSLMLARISWVLWESRWLSLKRRVGNTHGEPAAMTTFPAGETP